MSSTHKSSADRTDQEKEESSSCATRPSAEESCSNTCKRRSSPNEQPSAKRRRVSELCEASTSHSNDGNVATAAEDNGHGSEEKPKKKATLRSLTHVLDQEIAASSCDTGASCSSNLGSHTIPEGDTKQHTKRKADDGEETPRKRVKKTGTKQDRSFEERAEFLDKYEQQGLLGEGGCGSVFAGYRKSDNLQVAIKHIKKDKALCSHQYEDGTQVPLEVAAMLKLQEGRSSSPGHSAPVSLLDWFDLSDKLVLVMERPMPADDLCNCIINHGSLGENEAKVIMKQLVDAAVYLEEKQIFHRDIKPENILIETGSDVPRVRLIDFGLSCFVAERSRYTVFCGTSPHVPPEMLYDRSYTAGPTTVWQMGVVLYEALYNECFSSYKYLSKTIKIKEGFSKDCEDFLKKCLTISPRQRPSLQELQRHPWLL
ncbi:serine/threonine-protein kinase pim-2-like [Xenentodon cancila]